MRCAFCGLEFDERRGVAACGGCPLGRSCRLIRCPRCGYESPREPGWARRRRARRKERVWP